MVFIETCPSEKKDGASIDNPSHSVLSLGMFPANRL